MDSLRSNPPQFSRERPEWLSSLLALDKAPFPPQRGLPVPLARRPLPRRKARESLAVGRARPLAGLEVPFRDQG